MKLSFPYMGCVTGYKKLFGMLGHEIVMPQKPRQSTVDLGVKYSPEFICFPFKVMLGTYIEAAEKGAELIVSSGGHGPCRAGYYGELHGKLLKNLGYKTEVVIFDSIFRDFGAFMGVLRTIKNGTPLLRILRKLPYIFKLIYQMDHIEKEIKVQRAYEINRGEYNRVWDRIVRLYDATHDLRTLRHAKKEARRLLDAVPRRSVAEKDRMRVGIVGEIYVVMESSTNMDIEQTLNSLGIEVENVQYISDWVLHNIQPSWLGMGRSHHVIKKAKRFCRLNCGGHDMENVGWMIDFKERGFDGVVHLMPFACLPELVNQARIPKISKELDLPILSLSLDEQLGAAHNRTRVEAFVDLLIAKKEGGRPPESAASGDQKDKDAARELLHV